MPQVIMIIGGLDEHAAEGPLLYCLRAHPLAGEIVWDWLPTPADNGFRPAANHKLHEFRRALSVRLKNQEPVSLVLLKRLNKDVKGSLLSICKHALLAPGSVSTSKDLVDWIFSPTTNLVPRIEWHVGLRTASLFLLLSKLVRKKSWNKDLHGHQWTQEAHLLGDSPVRWDEFPQVRREANSLLKYLDGTLLIRKGGSDTPLEWGIDVAYLPMVKNAFLSRSITPLVTQPSLVGLTGFLAAEDAPTLRIDTRIEERVFAICHENVRQGSI
jgi:hypothetical protein